MKSPVACFIVLVLLVNTMFVSAGQGNELTLPKPGTMVHLSPAFNPAVLKGIKIDPQNPFKFEFVLDPGLNGDRHQLTVEANRLIKYFLAAITTPEKDLWVNLSPYEKDRIVPESFGQTEMGRDLLAQDYLLKQLTASLIYPEDDIGKKFWKKVYEQTANKNIPINTFNKVWIVPEKAVVFENVKNGTAYVVESSLKVLTEQDYLTAEKRDGYLVSKVEKTSKKVTVPFLGIVIPQLTKEVNEGANFAKLRQVYNSLILATWYKKKLKDSILAQTYADQNKINGTQYQDSLNVQSIYSRYLESFKKGAFNYIKDSDPTGVGSGAGVLRKYFSGGANMAMASKLEILSIGRYPRLAELVRSLKGLFRVQSRLEFYTSGQIQKQKMRAFFLLADYHNIDYAQTSTLRSRRILLLASLGLAGPASLMGIYKFLPTSNTHSLARKPVVEEKRITSKYLELLKVKNKDEFVKAIDDLRKKGSDEQEIFKVITKVSNALSGNVNFWNDLNRAYDWVIRNTPPEQVAYVSFKDFLALVDLTEIKSSEIVHLEIKAKEKLKERYQSLSVGLKASILVELTYVNSLLSRYLEYDPETLVSVIEAVESINPHEEEYLQFLPYLLPEKMRAVLNFFKEDHDAFIVAYSKALQEQGSSATAFRSLANSAQVSKGFIAAVTLSLSIGGILYYYSLPSEIPDAPRVSYIPTFDSNDQFSSQPQVEMNGNKLITKPNLPIIAATKQSEPDGEDYSKIRERMKQFMLEKIFRQNVLEFDPNQVHLDFINSESDKNLFESERVKDDWRKVADDYNQKISDKVKENKDFNLYLKVLLDVINGTPLVNNLPNDRDLDAILATALYASKEMDLERFRSAIDKAFQKSYLTHGQGLWTLALNEIMALIFLKIQSDHAQVANKGGIDLITNQMHLETNVDSGGAIEFKVTPQLLESLKKAAGFTPNIIEISPMGDLRIFLGITPP